MYIYTKDISRSLLHITSSPGLALALALAAGSDDLAPFLLLAALNSIRLCLPIYPSQLIRRCPGGRPPMAPLLPRSSEKDGATLFSANNRERDFGILFACLIGVVLLLWFT